MGWDSLAFLTVSGSTPSLSELLLLLLLPLSSSSAAEWYMDAVEEEAEEGEASTGSSGAV